MTHRVAEEVADHLERAFTAEAPGRVAVGDITYLKTGEGWLYLATVIDLHTRMVIGWQMAEHMRTSLVIEALAAAKEAGYLDQDAVFHSDRGTQGGFNWSLQHLDLGGVDGQASGMDEGTDGPVADEVAGTAVGQPEGGTAAVLGQDRRGIVQRGGCGHKWRIDAVGAQRVP
jgi:hypothetical protein